MAMRPQLGSAAKNAVLQRLSCATVRATATASASERAPRTATVTCLVTPSASACSCRHRSVQAACTAAVSSAALGVTPDAPEARSRTVSLVEVPPSMSSRSKVLPTAERSAASHAAVSATASVVSTTSMVAMAGAIMPEPLAKPPTEKPGAGGERLLGVVVGGEHGGRGGGGRLGRGGELGGGLLDPGEQGGPGQLLADDAGGADRDLDRRRSPGPRPPSPRWRGSSGSPPARCTRWRRRS